MVHDRSLNSPRVLVRVGCDGDVTVTCVNIKIKDP